MPLVLTRTISGFDSINPRPALTQPVAEFCPIESADAFQCVRLAVPKPERGQGDAVEGRGLHHRIMRLVEEGEALADGGRLG